MMCGLLVQLKQLCKTTTYVGFVDALFPLFFYIFNTLNYGIFYLLKKKNLLPVLCTKAMSTCTIKHAVYSMPNCMACTDWFHDGFIGN